MTENDSEVVEETANVDPRYYRIQFRPGGQLATGVSNIDRLVRDNVVLVATDHGQEPAVVVELSPLDGCHEEKREVPLQIERLAKPGEVEKYQGLLEGEEAAFQTCNRLIDKHKLSMNLVRVERFFNGSKMIFYFTADSRVDFRALVKDLVQEFRTRVEMRQIGVRHETKMIGGIGICGRELCCSSFISNFDSVSIKMAKEQDLPLNPAKISGLCNRLLCCLTYEYETYRHKRKQMPKVGKRVKIAQEQYLVKRQIPLQDLLVVENSEGDEVILTPEQWQGFENVKKEGSERKKGKSDKE
jgi:cell fate regulator YaaT (PSP1 superfamily)